VAYLEAERKRIRHGREESCSNAGSAFKSRSTLSQSSFILLPGYTKITADSSRARLPPAGAWLIHVVLILSGIVLLDIIPGMTQDLAWTIVNLGYLTVSSALHCSSVGLRLTEPPRSPPFFPPRFRSPTLYSTT